MARRVALARAIALDPMLIMYDEPFTGLDPISTGVIANLIRRLNDALGATSILVTHDVEESFKIADYVYFVSAGVIVAEGTPESLRGSTSRSSISSCTARPTGRCRFTIRPPPYARDLELERRAMIGALDRGLRHIGHLVVDGVWKLGAATRFSGYVLIRSGDSVRRVATDAERDLLQRHAVAHHHHRLRDVRRAGARAAGLRDAEAVRLRRSAWARWWRWRWCASWDRWCRRCCSPAAPARRSPPRSAS